MFAVMYIGAMIVTVVLLIMADDRQIGKALFMSTLLFGFIGFAMIPRDGLYVDTVRFFNTLDSARQFLDISEKSAWDYLMVNQNYAATPVIGIILFLIAHQPENGVLLFLTAVSQIGAAFYLIYCQLRSRKDKQSLILAVVFFLSTYNYNACVSGVRNIMAVALAVAVAYYFTIKKTTYFLFILFIPLILIHPFAIIIPVFLLLGGLNLRNKFLYFCCCCCAVLQRFFQSLLFSIFDRLSFIPFFESLSFKATQYFGENAYVGFSSIFSSVRASFIFCFAVFLICLALVEHYEVNSRYMGFVILTACFSLGAFSDEVLFSRCSRLLLFAALPFAVMFFESLRESRERIAEKLLVFFVVACITLISLADNLRAGVRFQVIEFDYIAIPAIGVWIVLLLVLFSTSHRDIMLKWTE